MTTVDQALLHAIRAVVGEAVAPLSEKIDGLSERVDGLGERVDGLSERVNPLKPSSMRSESFWRILARG